MAVLFDADQKSQLAGAGSSSADRSRSETRPKQKMRAPLPRRTDRRTGITSPRNRRFAKRSPSYGGRFAAHKMPPAQGRVSPPIQTVEIAVSLDDSGLVVGK